MASKRRRIFVLDGDLVTGQNQSSGGETAQRMRGLLAARDEQEGP